MSECLGTPFSKPTQAPCKQGNVLKDSYGSNAPLTHTKAQTKCTQEQHIYSSLKEKEKNGPVSGAKHKKNSVHRSPREQQRLVRFTVIDFLSETNEGSLFI